MPALRQRILGSKLTILFTGLTAGAVAAPLLGRAARPFVRGLIKAGLIVQKEVGRIATKMREELEDVTAEARHSLGEPPARAEPEHEGDHHPDRAQA